MTRNALAVAAFLTLASPALSQPIASKPPTVGPSLDDRVSYAEHKAVDILSQPVRDVGLFGEGIPEPLRRANQDPYGLVDTWSCSDIDAEIAQLNSSLGPDALAQSEHRESRVAKIAEAGGAAAVNSLIPFRTVVREVSGAAPAQRRLQTAKDNGYARRGFLRGVSRMRNCGRTPAAETEPKRPSGGTDGTPGSPGAPAPDAKLSAG